MTELTAARLRKMLHYDPETGVFTRLWTGNVTGCPDAKGYLRIAADGRSYRAHRLAVLYMTGAWPSEQIDHINQVRTDNRWSNLRPATNGENGANTHTHT